MDNYPLIETASKIIIRFTLYIIHYAKMARMASVY